MGRPPRGMEGGYGYVRGPPRPRGQARTKEAMAERRRQCIGRMTRAELSRWYLWRNYMDRFDPELHRSAVKRMASHTSSSSHGKKCARTQWKIGDRVAASLWMQPGPGLKMVHVFSEPATVLSTFQSNAPNKPRDYAVLRIARKFKRSTVVVATDQCVAHTDYRAR
jgi:hypothetical protein